MARRPRKRTDSLIHAVLLNPDLTSVVLKHAWDTFFESGDWTPGQTVERWLELSSVCKTWKVAMGPQAVKLHWSGDIKGDYSQQLPYALWLRDTPISVRELTAFYGVSYALCRPESSRTLLAKLAPTLISLSLHFCVDYTWLPPLTQLCKLKRLTVAGYHNDKRPLQLELPPSLTQLSIDSTEPKSRNTATVDFSDLGNLSGLTSLTLGQTTVCDSIEQLPASVQELELSLTAIPQKVWCNDLTLEKLVLTNCCSGHVVLESLLRIKHVHLMGPRTAHYGSSLQLNTQCRGYDAVAAMLTSSNIEELEVAARVSFVMRGERVAGELRDILTALLAGHLYDWQLLPDHTTGNNAVGLWEQKFHIRRQQPPLALTLRHAVTQAQLQPVMADCPPVRHLVLPQNQHLQMLVLGSVSLQGESAGTLATLKGLHLAPAAPSLQAFTALQEIDGIGGCLPPGRLPVQLVKLSLVACTTTNQRGDQPFTAAGLQHLTRLQHLALDGFTSYDFTGSPSPLPCLIIKNGASLLRPSDFPPGCQIGSVSLLGAGVSASSTHPGRFNRSSQYMEPQKVDLAGWLAIAQHVTIAAKVVLTCPTGDPAATAAILQALVSSPRALVLSLHCNCGTVHVEVGATKPKEVAFSDVHSTAQAPAYADVVLAEASDMPKTCVVPMLRLSRRRPVD